MPLLACKAPANCTHMCLQVRDRLHASFGTHIAPRIAFRPTAECGVECHVLGTRLFPLSLAKANRRLPAPQPWIQQVA